MGYSDIPLTVAGFDTRNCATRNRNQVTVTAEATGQNVSINVLELNLYAYCGLLEQVIQEKMKNIFRKSLLRRLLRSLITIGICMDIRGMNTSIRYSEHCAGLPIHSVAAGVVVTVGTSYGSNYIIVDSGGWGVLYLHIVESAQNSKVKVGDEVRAGQIIATEGSGGFHVHLHIEARVWKPDVNKFI